MNNRIAELSERAEDVVSWGDPHNHDHRIQGDIKFRQTFAELIIQECLGVVQQRWITPDEDTIANAIKQHFGVK